MERSRVRGRATVALVSVVMGLGAGPAPSAAAPLPVVAANDNTRAAGTPDQGVLRLRLRARAGVWSPEGPEGPSLVIEAFGEEGQPPVVPAPLIRVVEGATIAVALANDLTAPLRVHGLCARDGSACTPIDVPAGGRHEVRFAAGRPGTYHYWATSIGAPIPFREMAGAFVIDPAGQPAAADRVFVITEWTNLTGAQLRDIITADDVNAAFLAARPRFLFVMNGRSWPATERLRYPRGEAVRWRVVNLSSQTHPFHLHGFYFRVTRTGDGLRDGALRPSTGREVVTEVLRTGETMDLEWTPEREGNWLFHCHVMSHVWPERRLAAASAAPTAGTGGGHRTSHAHDDASLGMAGMVLGVTVTPGRAPAPAPASSAAPRRVRMIIGTGVPGAATHGIAIAPDGDGAMPVATAPGPVLVLQRGAPVEIAVENRLAEPTSIHWHGLELESLYDGVHGWSGAGARTAPMIPPGGTFVVRLTPPRAGTFIYHTHVHDYRQLTSGLYGGLVVAERLEDVDPATDHVVVVGRRHATEADSILEAADSVVLNGDRALRVVWSAGRTHRLRLVNITPDDILHIALTRAGDPVTWRVVAKDGASWDAPAAAAGPARVQLAVGETIDVEIATPAGPVEWWLDVRTTSGRWQAQAHVVVK